MSSTGGSRSEGFVGRERELALLQAALNDAIAGHGRLLLIAGEAGIGKTRLASELAARAVPAGAQVRWARCWEAGGAPAFWPWTVVVRGLARSCDDTELAAALGGGAAQVARLAPELCERLSAITELPPASAHDSEHVRFPLFDAVAGFLRRLAARRPLVLIVDDLHGADQASLLLLNFLGRDLQDSSVLVIGTCRDVDGQQDPMRAQLLNAIGRAGSRLPLAGLTENEVERIVAHSCGSPPAAGLVGALHRVTDGNPFFVDEIVRLLLAEGGGRLPTALTLKIPSSIRATTRERLRPLTHECLRVLAAAAVCGRDFQLSVLRAAIDADDSEERDGLALLNALGDAERLGVIERRGGALPRFRFTHALIRETLYEDLPAGDRLAWHRRIGEAFERLHAGNPDPVLDQLAHHFAHAAALDELDARGSEPLAAAGFDKAVDYDVRAARRAAGLLAFEEAAAHYARALQAVALRPPRDLGVELELRLELGDMQAAAWNLDAARQTFRDVAAQAQRRGLPDLLTRAALGFAGVGFGLPRGVVDAEIVALLEGALRALGERRDALWARAAVRLAVELHFSADAERRDALSQDAVAVARAVADPATLAYVINARHFAVWDSAEVEERMALAGEAVRCAEQAGDPDLALQARTWRLLDLGEVGDSVAFERELEIFDRLTGEHRLPKYLAFAAALRGLRALWLGRFEDAVGLAQEGLALGERVGDRAAFAVVAVQIFVARRAQGRLAEVEPLVRQWVERTPALPATHALLALTCVELGNLDDARQPYEHLAADDFVSLQRRNVLHPLLPYLTVVCEALGDRRRAPILYRALLPFAGRNMIIGPNVLIGPASHALGVLAAMLGQWDDAVRHFESGLEEATRMQGPAWLASIQYDYARALFAARGRDLAARALELVTAAASGAETLGMTRLGEQAGTLRAEIEAAAGPPRGQSRAAAAASAAHPSSDGAAGTGRDGGGSARVLRFPVRNGGRATTRSSGPHDGLFRCEGEYWTVGFGTDVLRLRNTSGLRYLAHLLRHAGREFHALDLASIEQSPDTAPALGAAQAAAAGLALGESAAAHELLDDQARSAYRRRLDDLRDQLEEARAFNDLARAAKLEHDIEFLTRELARAVGLGGRARPGSSRAERARLNVTRAVKSAIRRMAAGNRELGRYFETTVKTGTFCSYTPDPRFPVKWTF